MKDRKIIFLNASRSKPIEKVACRALVSTGSQVFIESDLNAARKRVQEENMDLVLVNYDTTDEKIRVFVTDLIKGAPKLPTVLVSEKKDKAHLIELFSHEQLRNLIARNGQVAEEELIITVEKLLRQDIFGMEKYLTWGVDFEKEEVRDSNCKKEQVHRVADFVRSLRCDERFVRLAEIVADELLMNALYDAPVNKEGKPLYAHLPRSERVQLEPDQAWLQYGSDGRYFAIACRDHFGALKAQTVVQYLRKCFSHDEYQVNTQQSGGGGVGFYMIFQSISQLVINIDPGVMTETMGLIDIRSMYREAKSRSKSFNIFIKEQ